MSEARKCDQCGASPTHEDANFCEFCGAELPVLERSAAKLVGPFGDLDERFRALERHEDLPRLMKHSPSTARVGLGLVGMALFGLIFTGASVVITLIFARVGGPLALFPMLFVAVGLWMIFRSLFKSAELSSAELHRVPLLLVDERMEVHGGQGDSSTSTRYFATVQAKDGGRAEYRVDSRLAGRVTRGDLGIGYIKSDYLLDFRRVPV